MEVWKTFILKFCFYFTISYLPSLLVFYVTENVLHSILLLFFNVCLAYIHHRRLSKYRKVTWTLETLIDELENIDLNKRPFVIERFMEINREKAKRNLKNVCEWERCVICLDEPAEIETLPCKHKVICRFCAWKTFKVAMQKSAIHLCVVCRSQIKDFNGSLFTNLTHLSRQDISAVLDETKALWTNKIVHK